VREGEGGGGGNVGYQGLSNHDSNAATASGTGKGEGTVAGGSKVPAFGFIPDREKPGLADSEDIDVLVVDEVVDGGTLLYPGAEGLGVEDSEVEGSGARAKILARDSGYVYQVVRVDP
jgi:hypothetical protein